MPAQTWGSTNSCNVVSLGAFSLLYSSCDTLATSPRMVPKCVYVCVEASGRPEICGF